MACPQEGVMEQETSYLNTLTKVTHYTIDGNNLLLFDANDLVIAQFSQ